MLSLSAKGLSRCASPVKLFSPFLTLGARTFIPLKSKLPTVYEPLPKKRNGENPVSYIHRQLLEKYDPTGKRRSLIDQSEGIRSGDVIRVTYNDRSNVVGQVIAIKRCVNSVGSNILIRNKFNKLGIEVRIPLFNPKLRNIEVLHKPKKYLSRRKQFYIRNSKHDVGDVEATLRRESKK